MRWNRWAIFKRVSGALLLFCVSILVTSAGTSHQTFDLVRDEKLGHIRLSPRATFLGASYPTGSLEYRVLTITENLSGLAFGVLMGMLFVWIYVSLAKHIAKRKALKNRGCCSSCGYDLRATPKRCPECGMVPFQASGLQSTADATNCQPYVALRITSNWQAGNKDAE
jgi:hypothetical protein